MMGKISNWIEDRLINVSEGLFWLFVLVVGLVLVGGTANAFVGQALEWLKDGYLPSRDGFWLYSLIECGGGWCRHEILAPTDWVGVNRIISWIMDLHVVFYTVFIGWIAAGTATAWAESLRNWKDLEARLRAPPPPLDDDA
ncbi:MAG: hypothetical protein L3J30_11140 [Marinosulfonomonas sp.]|nr:hypothetical protein [Marinosulfonomonas sp.]